MAPADRVTPEKWRASHAGAHAPSSLPAISARRLSSGSLDHGPKRDRIPGRLDGGDAVFPDLPGGAGQHVERPRLGIERDALPLFAGRPPESEFAGGSERQAEHPVELRLVAVPANADP